MDATKIDQEFVQLQTEFQDVAKTVQGLAEKMQAAENAGDTNATEWLGDLKQVAQEVDEEQAQVQKLLLALHEFIGAAAEAHQAAAAEDKPPLFAPGHEPAGMEEGQQPAQQQHHSFLGGMFGGMGGGYYGGYYGGSFGQAMAAGAAMSLGSSLVSSVFR